MRAEPNLQPESSLADRSFTAADLAGREPPARPWHVPGLIPVRAVTLLQGDGGTGKSILAAQLSVATALGRPWLSQSVRRGNVLYFSAEDDRDELHRRLDAICIDYGVGLDELTGLKVLDMTGQDTVLASAGRDGRLSPTARWLDLVQLAEAWEPVLIVIDNLADVFAGEENSRPHARQFVSLLAGCAARLNASLVVIGHPSIQGMSSGTGSSGSTAWNNSVRSRLYLTRPKPEDDGFAAPDERLLTVVKANYAPSNTAFRLRWRAGAFVTDGAMEAALSPAATAIAEVQADNVFLALLDTYETQGRSVSHQPSATYAPAVFVKDPAAKGLTKKGLMAAMNRLFAAKRIVVQVHGPASRQRHRIVRAEVAN